MTSKLCFLCNLTDHDDDDNDNDDDDDCYGDCGDDGDDDAEFFHACCAKVLSAPSQERRRARITA